MKAFDCFFDCLDIFLRSTKVGLSGISLEKSIFGGCNTSRYSMRLAENICGRIAEIQLVVKSGKGGQCVWVWKDFLGGREW